MADLNGLSPAMLATVVAELDKRVGALEAVAGYLNVDLSRQRLEDMDRAIHGLQEQVADLGKEVRALGPAR